MSESSPGIQLRMDRGRLRDALLQRATSPLLLTLATSIALALLNQSSVSWFYWIDEPWHIAYSVRDQVKLGHCTIRPATLRASKSLWCPCHPAAR